GFGPRRVPAERLARLLARARPNTNVDTLPRERFRLVKQAMQQRGVTQRAMASLRGTAYGGTAHFRFAPSRALLAEYARILDEPALLAESENEVFWDRVIAIEPAGAGDGRRHGLGVALAALTRDGGAGRREHPLRFDSAPLNRVLRSAAAG